MKSSTHGCRPAITFDFVSTKQKLGDELVSAELFLRFRLELGCGVHFQTLACGCALGQESKA